MSSATAARARDPRSPLLDRFVSCQPSTPLIDRNVRELFLAASPSDPDDHSGDVHASTDGSAVLASDGRAMVRLDHAYRRAVALGVRTTSELARERSASPRRRAHAAVSAVLRVEPTTGDAVHWVSATRLPSDVLDKPLDAAATRAASSAATIPASSESLREGALPLDAPSADTSGAAAGGIRLSPRERAALMRLYNSTGRPADLVAMPRR